MSAPVIMITAAEASGDLHAAGLIEAIRARRPDARFVGIGGQRMAAAGCELIDEPVGRSAMLTSALGGVRYFHGVIGHVKRAMDQHRPAVHVPVDSPALNWHLAKAARRRGIPVMYYVAPQVWAWAPWRVKKLRRLTDAVACILPFEQDYLRRRGVNAHFVGHPLFDQLEPPALPDIASAAREGAFRVALLPGSRRAEIAAHTPAMVHARERLARRFPRARFTFAAVDEPAAEQIRQAAPATDIPIVVGQTSSVLSESHFAITASGTATLQVAHFGVPLVVFYHASRLAYHLFGRWLIRTPYLSLVNILAGTELVPELMPWFGDADAVARSAEAMLSDAQGLIRVRTELLGLVRPLKAAPPATAAGNAADLVLGLLP